ncbi:MAG: twin transmembrane helix small protein [Pseudomonadota bacterium]
MGDTTYYLTFVASLAVLVVLCFGLFNLARAGTASLSQQLMRWRIGLQLLAIVIIMAAVYFAKG